jgi:hypothetical protein
LLTSALVALVAPALATTTTDDLVLPPWEGCVPLTVTVSSAFSPLTLPTTSRPQSATLAAAIRWGTAMNACKLVLLVESGTYTENVRFDRQTDLLGRGRTNPIVRGRIESTGQTVSVNHVTVTGVAGDAIVQRGGRLVLNDVAVTDTALSKGSGWAVRASDGAQVDAWDLDLLRSIGGLRAEGRGTVVRVTDSWIAWNGAAGAFTAGVDASAEAMVTLDGTVVEGNLHLGVSASGAARVDLVASEVRDTLVDSGLSGVNLWVDSGASLTALDFTTTGGEIGFLHGDGYVSLLNGLITDNLIGIHATVSNVNYGCMEGTLNTGNNVDQDFSQVSIPGFDLGCVKGDCESPVPVARRCAEVPVR